MSNGNPYSPISAKIESVIDETPTIKTFILTPSEQLHFDTGQFVEITVPGLGESPFTPSSSPMIKDRMDVTIMKAGKVTSRLHQMSEGSIVGVRGPFGKGYPLSEFKGKEVLVFGGGVGLAPLKSLLLTMFDRLNDFKRVILKYGARTPADIVYKGELKEWAKKIEVDLTVDRGDETWKGKVGLVTTLLENGHLDTENGVAVVCGPPVMMKFSTLKLLEIGYKPSSIYLSMEKNMSCGIGKCGHCRLGKYYVCKDGPVFTYEAIADIPEIWD
ncbi:MAG: oxidoreductase [Spirochaetes bacterium]|nr:MAG: oxidoreductase [Spirochaetota bacterium]